MDHKERRRANERTRKKKKKNTPLSLSFSLARSFALLKLDLLPRTNFHALALLALPDERIPPTTELAIPAAANSAAATASASVVSPARLRDRPAPAAAAAAGAAAFFEEALGSEGTDSVNVFGAALGTAARLTALVVTAVAVAAVAVAALAALAPLGAGGGAAMTALGVAAAPCETEEALLPDLPKVTFAEVGLKAGAAVFLPPDALARGLLLLLLLVVLALGLLLVEDGFFPAAADLVTAGALPADCAAAVSEIGDLVLTVFTPLEFLATSVLRASPWPVEAGARAARAGEASPNRSAAARPAAARAEPKLVLFFFC